MVIVLVLGGVVAGAMVLDASGMTGGSHGTPAGDQTTPPGAPHDGGQVGHTMSPGSHH